MKSKAVIGLSAGTILMAAVAIFGFLRESGDLSNSRPSLPGTTASVQAPPVRVRMPGEFENQDALMISAAQMIQFHPEVLVDIVAACDSSVEVVCLVGSETEMRLVEARLREHGLPPEAVHFLAAPMMTMWVRDWGPVQVVKAGGQPLLIDAHYEGNARNQSDDAVGASLASSFDLPVRQLPLTLEGGDILSNGQGLGLTSRRVVQRNEASRGYDQARVAKLLLQHYGFVDWFPLPSLIGEPTGHVDMYITFIDSVTVVVGRYDTKVDPANAALLDRVAEALEGFETKAGILKVERVTMPARPDGYWRSFTNVVFANDRILVPTYPDHCPDLDEEALALYRKLLPDREVVGIDCSNLIRRNGALHCVTLNIPFIHSSPPGSTS